MARKGWSPLVTLIMVLSAPFVLWMWFAVIEAVTLGDATPDNHITASFRWALDVNPHLFVVVLLTLTILYTAPFWTVLGHVFHNWGGADKTMVPWTCSCGTIANLGKACRKCGAHKGVLR